MRRATVRKSIVGRRRRFEPEQPKIPGFPANIEVWHADSHPDTKNPDGSPKVFYHATDRPGFPAFRRNPHQIGIHFGGNPGQAEERLRQKIGHLPGLSVDPRVGGTYPVHLRIRKPLEISDVGIWDLEYMGERLHHHQSGRFSEEELSRVEREHPHPVAQAKALQKLIESKGYDGLKYVNHFEEPELYQLHRLAGSYGVAPEVRVKARADYDHIVSTRDVHSYAVFHPEQIKSAIGNRGSFSGREKDIRKAISATTARRINLELKDARKERSSVSRQTQDTRYAPPDPQMFLPFPDKHGKGVNFDQWFGESKAVDREGKPSVLLGAKSAFKGRSYRRNPNRVGIHFHPKGVHEAYWGGAEKGRMAAGLPVAQGGEHYTPVHVRSHSPLDVEDAHVWDSEHTARALHETGRFTPESTHEAVRGESTEAGRTRALSELIQSRGYDSLRYRKRHPSTGADISGGEHSYAVFTGKQAKSALHNTGDYHPHVSDLGKSLPQYWGERNGEANVYYSKGGVEMQTPYHPGLVDDIKTLIPRHERGFHGGAWHLHPKHYAGAIQLVQKHFGKNPTYREETSGHAGGGRMGHYRAIWENQPEELVKSVAPPRRKVVVAHMINNLRSQLMRNDTQGLAHREEALHIVDQKGNLVHSAHGKGERDISRFIAGDRGVEALHGYAGPHIPSDDKLRGAMRGNIVIHSHPGTWSSKYGDIPSDYDFSYDRQSSRLSHGDVIAALTHGATHIIATTGLHHFGMKLPTSPREREGLLSWAVAHERDNDDVGIGHETAKRVAKLYKGSYYVKRHSLEQIQKSTSLSKALGYKLVGFMRIRGLEIAIENRKGSVRRGKDKDGKPWAIRMLYPYGGIRNTSFFTRDSDCLDVFVGPNKDSSTVFVIHQQHPDTKKFDEDKVMLFFDTWEQARDAYLAHYDNQDFLPADPKRAHTDMSFEEFKRKIFDKGRKRGIVKSLAAGAKSHAEQWLASKYHHGESDDDLLNPGSDWKGFISHSGEIYHWHPKNSVTGTASDLGLHPYHAHVRGAYYGAGVHDKGADPVSFQDSGLTAIGKLHDLRGGDHYLSTSIDGGTSKQAMGRILALGREHERGGGELSVDIFSPEHGHRYATSMKDMVSHPHVREIMGWEPLSKSLPKTEKCKYCSMQATKRYLWAEGMAYIPACGEHAAKARARIAKIYGKPDAVREIKKAYDASDTYFRPGKIPQAYHPTISRPHGVSETLFASKATPEQAASGSYKGFLGPSGEISGNLLSGKETDPLAAIMGNHHAQALEEATKVSGGAGQGSLLERLGSQSVGRILTGNGSVSVSFGHRPSEAQLEAVEMLHSAAQAGGGSLVWELKHGGRMVGGEGPESLAEHVSGISKGLGAASRRGRSGTALIERAMREVHGVIRPQDTHDIRSFIGPSGDIYGEAKKGGGHSARAREALAHAGFRVEPPPPPGIGDIDSHRDRLTSRGFAAYHHWPRAGFAEDGVGVELWKKPTAAQAGSILAIAAHHKREGRNTQVSFHDGSYADGLDAIREHRHIREALGEISKAVLPDPGPRRHKAVLAGLVRNLRDQYTKNSGDPYDQRALVEQAHIIDRHGNLAHSIIGKGYSQREFTTGSSGEGTSVDVHGGRPFVALDDKALESLPGGALVHSHPGFKTTKESRYDNADYSIDKDRVLPSLEDINVGLRRGARHVVTVTPLHYSILKLPEDAEHRGALRSWVNTRAHMTLAHGEYHSHETLEKAARSYGGRYVVKRHPRFTAISKSVLPDPGPRRQKVVERHLVSTLARHSSKGYGEHGYIIHRKGNIEQAVEGQHYNREFSNVGINRGKPHTRELREARHGLNPAVSYMVNTPPFMASGKVLLHSHPRMSGMLEGKNLEDKGFRQAAEIQDSGSWKSDYEKESLMHAHATLSPADIHSGLILGAHHVTAVTPTHSYVYELPERNEDRVRLANNLGNELFVSSGATMDSKHTILRRLSGKYGGRYRVIPHDPALKHLERTYTRDEGHGIHGGTPYFVQDPSGKHLVSDASGETRELSGNLPMRISKAIARKLGEGSSGEHEIWVSGRNGVHYKAYYHPGLNRIRVVGPGGEPMQKGWGSLLCWEPTPEAIEKALSDWEPKKGPVAAVVNPGNSKIRQWLSSRVSTGASDDDLLNPYKDWKGFIGPKGEAYSWNHEESGPSTRGICGLRPHHAQVLERGSGSYRYTGEDNAMEQGSLVRAYKAHEGYDHVLGFDSRKTLTSHQARRIAELAREHEKGGGRVEIEVSPRKPPYGYYKTHRDFVQSDHYRTAVGMEPLDKALSDWEPKERVVRKVDPGGSKVRQWLSRNTQTDWSDDDMLQEDRDWKAYIGPRGEAYGWHNKGPRRTGSIDEIYPYHGEVLRDGAEKGEGKSPPLDDGGQMSLRTELDYQRNHNLVRAYKEHAGMGKHEVGFHFAGIPTADQARRAESLARKHEDGGGDVIFDYDIPGVSMGFHASTRGFVGSDVYKKATGLDKALRLLRKAARLTRREIAEHSLRWITAHPNGPGSEGVPLLVHDDGTHYTVVGGAGGKLDQMVLKKPKAHLDSDKQAERSVKKIKPPKPTLSEELRAQTEEKKAILNTAIKQKAEEIRQQAEQILGAPELLKHVLSEYKRQALEEVGRLHKDASRPEVEEHVARRLEEGKQAFKREVKHAVERVGIQAMEAQAMARLNGEASDETIDASKFRLEIAGAEIARTLSKEDREAIVGAQVSLTSLRSQKRKLDKELRSEKIDTGGLMDIIDTRMPSEDEMDSWAKQGLSDRERVINNTDLVRSGLAAPTGNQNRHQAAGASDAINTITSSLTGKSIVGSTLAKEIGVENAGRVAAAWLLSQGAPGEKVADALRDRVGLEGHLDVAAALDSCAQADAVAANAEKLASAGDGSVTRAQAASIAAQMAQVKYRIANVARGQLRGLQSMAYSLKSGLGTEPMVLDAGNTTIEARAIAKGLGLDSGDYTIQASERGQSRKIAIKTEALAKLAVPRSLRDGKRSRTMDEVRDDARENWRDITIPGMAQGVTWKGPHQPEAVLGILRSRKIIVAHSAGCITGDTIIADPLTGATMPVSEWAERRMAPHVWALDDNGKAVVAQASIPFIKAFAPMYEVVTNTGARITVSMEHKFLTQSGWKPLSQIALGERVAVPNIPSSPRQPSLACIEAARTSSGTLPQGGSTSPHRFCTQTPIGVFAAHVHHNETFPLPASWPDYSTHWAQVTSVAYSRDDLVYDLEVYRHHNYLAQGVWNHNSGKTSIQYGAAAGLLTSGECKYGVITMPQKPRAAQEDHDEVKVDPETGAETTVHKIGEKNKFLSPELAEQTVVVKSGGHLKRILSGKLGDPRILILSPELLREHVDLIAVSRYSGDGTFFFGDEAHQASIGMSEGSGIQLAQAIRRVASAATYAALLTATPLERSPSEFHSLAVSLGDVDGKPVASTLGPARSFSEEWERLAQAPGGVLGGLATARLRDKISGITSLHYEEATRADEEGEQVPIRIEQQVIVVPTTPGQREALAASHEQHRRDRYSENPRVRKEAALMRNRRDEDIVRGGSSDPKAADYNPKWAELDRIMSQARVEDPKARILVYADHLKPIATARKVLEPYGAVVQITGENKGADTMRALDVTNDRSNDAAALLVTRAGNFGINATGAKQVVLTHNMDNPATKNQIDHRVARWGQDDDVVSTTLLSEHPVEQVRHFRSEKLKKRNLDLLERMAQQEDDTGTMDSIVASMPDIVRMAKGV